MAPTPQSDGGLNVIALISGGKDSFFSALHCLENGHRVVALANLHPPPTPTPPSRAASGKSSSASGSSSGPGAQLPGGSHHEGSQPSYDGTSGDPDSSLAQLDLNEDRPQEDGVSVDDDETDLNSFMYQTVGHQVIPLYSIATGIPLYRQPIAGGAVQSGREYSTASTTTDDEVESMLQLLERVKAAHPEANAVSAGAILSTYQRTRVESVAIRLGLTPLAYLWKYPVLPPPPSASGGEDEAQLLYDMASAGLDARIIKVASGALNENFLWENVASAKGTTRLKVAASRFGGEGAVLGEGGEFETLVVDGPSKLFKKRIEVSEENKAVVPEGGDTAWLKIRDPRVVDKVINEADEKSLVIRRPELLDERFSATLENMQSVDQTHVNEDTEVQVPVSSTKPTLQSWAFIGHPQQGELSIEADTSVLIDAIRARLRQHELTPRDIVSTVVILRSMSDFQTINKVYGSLFTDPNPPSRVTIACGNILPQDTKIAIYATVPESSAADRQGLHVQSRSYWAPANIGPYSQAITIPMGPTRELANASRMAHIAGQIPLVPATMELPTDGGLEMQLVLSLQHLWRIGVEMGVQWWTSATVYFPRASRSAYDLPARDKAMLAWRAWKAAHLWVSPKLTDDSSSGPDLWDRRFNAKYLFYSNGEADKAKKASLPYYADTVDTTGEEDDGPARKRPVPFFFAAEVDELPRSAEAEWHAHAGLIHLPWEEDDASRFAVYDEERSDTASGGRCLLSHSAVVLDEGAEAHTCLHSAAAIEAPQRGDVAARPQQFRKAQIEEAGKLVAASYGSRFGCASSVGAEVAEAKDPVPYLVYVNCEVFEPAQVGTVMSELGLAAVPCASLYGGPGGGTQFALVAMYRTLLGPVVD